MVATCIRPSISSDLAGLPDKRYHFFHAAFLRAGASRRGPGLRDRAQWLEQALRWPRAHGGA